MHILDELTWHAARDIYFAADAGLPIQVLSYFELVGSNEIDHFV